VKRRGELVSLAVSKLTYVQKAKLRMLCEQKLQEYVQRRGPGSGLPFVGDRPVPDSLRYRVLKGRRVAVLCAVLPRKNAPSM